MKTREEKQALNDTIDIYIQYLRNCRGTRILSITEQRGYDEAIADLEKLKIPVEE